MKSIKNMASGKGSEKKMGACIVEVYAEGAELSLY